MTTVDPVLYYPPDKFLLGMAAPVPGDREPLIIDALESASRAVETYCGGRIFWRTPLTAYELRPRDRVVSAEDGDELLVDDLAAAPTLVEIRGRRGGTWRPVTGFDLEPDVALERGRPVRSLLADPGTWAGDRIRITAEWGWPAIPVDIRQAVRLLANRLYLRKDSPDGTAGVGEWGPVRVAAADPDVRALLEPFRLESAG